MRSPDRKAVASGRPAGLTRLGRRAFGHMRRKVGMPWAADYLVRGEPAGEPRPPWLSRRLMAHVREKAGDKALRKIADTMSFELGWWRERGWLGLRSLKQAAALPLPEGFDRMQRLIESRVRPRTRRLREQATAATA